MYIQNRNLANTALALAGGLTRTGDPDGIFEVPDEIGSQLVQTPGWAQTDKKPQLPEEVDPVKALKALREAQKGQPVHPLPQPPAPGTPAPTTPVAAPPAAPAPAAPDVEEASGEEEGEGEEGEEVDLTAMGQKELLQTAKDYGIKLSTKLQRGKVTELRAYLDKTLFGG